MLIHASQFAKPSRVFTQTAYECGITLIQQIFAFAAALIKLFTVRQDIFCRAELFLFAGHETRRSEDARIALIRRRGPAMGGMRALGLMGRMSLKSPITPILPINSHRLPSRRLGNRD